VDRGRPGRVVPAAVALAAVAVAAAAGCGGSRERASPAVATVVVDAARPGRAVPRSFLGIATEWDSIRAYAGTAARRRTELVSLLRAAGQAQGAPLALRIGGDSADQAWWDPSGRRRPPKVLYDLGARELDDAAWLAHGLGGPVTLGLNLALGDASNAVTLGRELRRRIGGRLEAVELGNEPDFYGRPDRRWSVPGYFHVRLRKRPASYSAADYGREAQRLLTAVRHGLGPRVRVVAAGFATPRWWPGLPGLLRAWRPAPDVVAGHLYALTRCAGASPGPDWLMAGERAREAATRLAPLARIAHRAGLPWRVTELNSAPCGGRAGMSDSPASALWLADTLFALLAAGAQQADVQTWDHARYAVVALQGKGARPRPALDGMLAFARAAPAGSRLVRTSVRGGDDVRAWATSGHRGTERVLLVVPHGADVRLRRRTSQASCPGAWLATPDGHATLRLRRAGDACRLLVPAESVAVLTVPPAGRG
jgi:hypothetical protein